MRSRRFNDTACTRTATSCAAGARASTSRSASSSVSPLGANCHWRTVSADSALGASSASAAAAGAKQEKRNCIERSPCVNAWPALQPSRVFALALLRLDLRPMPRLVLEAEAVVVPVRHAETEFLGVRLQPLERRRAVELRRQRPRSRRRDVDGAARVVLAESRRGVDGEDRVDRLPGRELAPDDVGLMADAAEARDEQQTARRRRPRSFHLAPRRGRFGCEPLHRADEVRLDLDESGGFPELRAARIAAVIPRYSEVRERVGARHVFECTTDSAARQRPPACGVMP